MIFVSKFVDKITFLTSQWIWMMHLKSINIIKLYGISKCHQLSYNSFCGGDTINKSELIFLFLLFRYFHFNHSDTFILLMCVSLAHFFRNTIKTTSKWANLHNYLTIISIITFCDVSRCLYVFWMQKTFFVDISYYQSFFIYFLSYICIVRSHYYNIMEYK